MVEKGGGSASRWRWCFGGAVGGSEVAARTRHGVAMPMEVVA
jgi:hypothetical protein